MNDIQRTAALSTLKMALTALCIGSIIPLMFYLIPFDYIMAGILVVSLYFFVKLVYTLEVDRITRERAKKEQQNG